MVYLITWNINKAGNLYAQQRAKFLSGFNGLDWIHEANLDTVAFLNTTSSANEIYNHLKRNLDDNDRLYITQVGKNHEGYLNTPVANWLKGKV